MRALAVFWMTLALALPAHAGDPGKSAALKTHADRAFGEGDYLKALKLLEAAYEADPNPGLRANMGLVYKELGEYGEAVKAFRAFLESNPPPQKAQMAHTLIAELEPTVSLSSQPAGAAVFIDDGPKPVGRTPLQIPLVAGAHRAVLKLPGHAPATKRLRVLPGKPLAVDVKLTPGYGGAPVQVDEPEPMVPMAVTHPVTPRGGASKGLAWTLVGLGAVAAGGAVAAQVFGREAASDRDAARTGAAWDDAHDQVGTWNLVFWASTGVAAAAVTTGVILLTTGDGPGPVQVGVGPGGASLSGRF